jgi:hypothetical protein
MPKDFTEDGKVIPDEQDCAAISAQYGRLPYNATIEEIGHHYRLAQVAKLIRHYRAGTLERICDD